MKIAVPAEVAEGERRVALVPETVKRLVNAGAEVAVQSGAGAAAEFTDEAYRDAGADIVSDAAAVLADADIVCTVGEPSAEQLGHLKEGAVLVGMLRARQNPELLQSLAARNVTAFSMEMVPRIARAQRLDVLSSQSSLAGYKAVLMAANGIGRFFPLMMTAAGTIPPANVVVLGAGVAGLQAIATAKRLGAKVQAYDVRAAVKEQVESLGGTFIEVETEEDAEDAGGYAREQSEEQQARQREVLAGFIARADVVITTALIPGRPAPTLITQEVLDRMKRGAIVIDLAAEAGGNCVATVPGERITTPNGVIVAGPLNVPSSMPEEASLLYSRNLQGLLELIIGEDGVAMDFEDEVVAGTAVTHGGKLVGQVAEG